MTDETENELMEATYRALCKHGYASLRMQDIADESTKSKAALHYHYDSKHDLLLAFLDYLYERFEDELAETTDGSPTERLVGFVEERLTPRDEETHDEFQTAILEIKAQGPYDDDFRDRLAKFDQLMHDHVRAIIVDGVEAGAFADDLDADEAAEFFVTVINGAQTRHIAVGYAIDDARRTLLDYVDAHVLADDAAVEVGAE